MRFQPDDSDDDPAFDREAGGNPMPAFNKRVLDFLIILAAIVLLLFAGHLASR